METGTNNHFVRTCSGVKKKVSKIYILTEASHHTVLTSVNSMFSVFFVVYAVHTTYCVSLSDIIMTFVIVQKIKAVCLKI